ncbi:MAG: hypothetical protein M1830_006868 [Pleopsidium flavum]|nr:MAG: hypothetical protein M1830_006868 [Pleopsidium flavum]
MSYSPLFIGLQNNILADPTNNPPSRAPNLPQVEPSESSASSMVDVDSPHISSVTSDYDSQSVKTDTQAHRLENEAEDEARELADEASEGYENISHEAKDKYNKGSQEAKDKYNKGSQEAKEKYEKGSQEAKDKYEELSHEAKEKYKEAKKVANKKASQAKSKAKDAEKDMRENSDNPVVVGNAVVIAALSAALGFGAYRKYAAGELTWKVAGAWAGVVGLFAAGDYYLSQYLFKNKYPKK